MAAIRENIMTSALAREKFLQGCQALDQEMPGITAQDVFNFLRSNSIPLPMQGRNQPLSTYDLFVLWHIVAMSISLPVGNAAHGGPVFLPWHRMYMIRLEEEMQRVLGDDGFGLPYWDWAADGELPTSAQSTTPLWTESFIGAPSGSVTAGAVGSMRVRLRQHVTGALLSIEPRPIQRAAGVDAPNLPTRAQVQLAMNETEYDRSPWSQSADSHRNRLEGWLSGPQLHNLVHVWIGGDMSPGTSPNDPAFFLNHCNVDRIWEAWMGNRGRDYRPGSGEGPAGHRIDDLMVAVLGGAQRPSDVLDPAPWYSYDSLAVA